MDYAPKHPCRCGFDGTGVHRCHAGRADPRLGEDGSRRCPHPAKNHLQATAASLAGVQFKVGVVDVHYCEVHYADYRAGREPTMLEGM